MSDWALFNNNLPAITSSTQLVIDYKNRKIVNGTNRSAYSCDLYETNTTPVACIAVDQFSKACLRDTFYFFDHSALSANGASWNWSFPGGTPSSSTLRNPKVIYTSTGKKTVSLTVTDVNGTSTQTLNQFLSVDDKCKTDTIPGYALLLDGNSGKATLPAFNLNSNTVTLEAWIKPDLTQHDWGGLIFSRSSGSAAGISIRNNLEVRYHWNDNYWGWSSGLYMKANEWNHVVLVITPNSGTIYVNGIAKTNNGTHNTETFSSATMIGYDPNGGARYVAGKVDEVCIYNRSLSQNEIREHMHLTRPAGADPSLVAYYQMNEAGTDILDKANGYHGTASSGTSKVKSTAPLGGGNSARMNVNSSGTYTFGNTGASLTWNTSTPAGEVVASRINLRPDTLPSSANASRCYWILDNYGSDTNARLNKIILNNVGAISNTDAQTPSNFKLFQRKPRADLFTWGNTVKLADTAFAGTRGKLIYNNCSLSSNGQLIAMSASNNSFTETESIISSSDNIQVYPNLIARQDAVKINCNNSPYNEIIIYDDQGRFFFHQSFGEEISISPKWKTGVYFYRVKSSNQLKCGKIIVQD
jgi:PKD repeat protein